MIIIENPWESKESSYKGQLHCHTTNSDGADSPTAVVTAYKNADYDFCSITDHNYFTTDPSVSDILFIPGVEETYSWGHMTATNVTAKASSTTPQEIIDDIIADGGIAGLAHPNYSVGWSWSQVFWQEGYSFCEIYNSLVDSFVGEEGYGEDKYDYLLSKGKPCWCVAVDDCHDISVSSVFDGGYVVVNSDTLTITAIKTSLSEGNFYASTGATISSISVSGNIISVTTADSSTIKWIGFEEEELRSTSTSTSDSYTVTGREKYVRIKITKDSDSTEAWSQPLTVVQKKPLPEFRGEVVR